MSVIGLTNTLGRVMAGWLVDRPTVTAISVNSAALLVGGLACVAFSFTDSYTLLVTEAAVFGLCMGECIRTHLTAHGSRFRFTTCHGLVLNCLLFVIAQKR